MTETQPAASEIPHRRVEEEECVHVISLASGKRRNNFNRIQPHVFASKVLKSSGVFFFLSFFRVLEHLSKKKVMSFRTDTVNQSRHQRQINYIQQEQCYFPNHD